MFPCGQRVMDRYGVGVRQRGGGVMMDDARKQKTVKRYGEMYHGAGEREEE